MEPRSTLGMWWDGKRVEPGGSRAHCDSIQDHGQKRPQAGRRDGNLDGARKISILIHGVSDLMFQVYEMRT